MFSTLLEKISLGSPCAYRNLALTPILLKDASISSIELLCLEEALAAGSFRVSEISAEGHVPELRVENSGDAPVLILDGEELVGAKQNRIVNVTILVPPQSEIIIPVTCIEAGRWGYERPGFAAAGRVLNQEIRYRKAEAVTRSLKKRRLRFSDQRMVWSDVDKTLFALGAASPTRALSDGFENRANTIAGFLAAFPSHDRQIGIIYRIAGKSLQCRSAHELRECTRERALRAEEVEAGECAANARRTRPPQRGQERRARTFGDPFAKQAIPSRRTTSALGGGSSKSILTQP